MFTEFKFDSKAIKELAAEKAANLKSNKGYSDLAGFALAVVAKRLARDPVRYRDYGPYWWALKDALRRSGSNMGERDDTMLREAYSGQTDLDTIVMADQFRDLYLATWPVGANQFSLDADSPDIYTLEDQDMEDLIR